HLHISVVLLNQTRRQRRICIVEGRKGAVDISYALPEGVAIPAGTLIVGFQACGQGLERMDYCRIELVLLRDDPLHIPAGQAVSQLFGLPQQRQPRSKGLWYHLPEGIELLKSRSQPMVARLIGGGKPWGTGGATVGSAAVVEQRCGHLLPGIACGQ